MLKLSRSKVRVNTFFHINYSVDSQKWNIWRSLVAPPWKKPRKARTALCGNFYCSCVRCSLPDAVGALLDRSLKSPSEFARLTQEIAGLQSGIRDLEVQARNQALQLERIEQQLGACG
jgi:hypothetical protein